MSDKNGRQIQLYGRVVVTGQIKAVTGLHIGTSKETIEIGGVDMAVIRNPVNHQPYIPGSSLKGKMRALWEKLNGSEFNTSIGSTNSPVFIHTCKREKQDNDDSYAKRYNQCPVCTIYGVTGDAGAPAPTRLIVRDIQLVTEGKDKLPDIVVDYTEFKWEAAIDRVTSAATPRQMERVPAGAVFGPMELVFSFYTTEDVRRFGDVLTALQLVEDDYLGGQGSRGSGKVAFEGLQLALKSGVNGYDRPLYRPDLERYADLAAILQDKVNILEWLRANLKF